MLLPNNIPRIMTTAGSQMMLRQKANQDRKAFH